MAVQVQRARDGGGHVGGRVAVEQDAGGAGHGGQGLVRAGVRDRVGHAADPRADRQGAIAHGVKRRQAERLEAAAVQQHVAAGVQPVRAGLVVADAHGAAARKAPGQFGQGGLQMALALAQHRHLQRRVRLQRLGQRLRGHIGHLLAGQAAAHDHQDGLRIFPQSVLMLHGRLAQALVGEVGGAVAQRAKVRVARRVPQLRVDAVGDGQQIGLAFAQDAVQAAAERGVQDLARIPLADGGDAIGVAYAGLHEIQLAPGHRAVLAAEGGPDPQRGGVFERGLTLERKIVDRQDALDVFDARGPQQQGRQRRVPVVRVHQIGARQPRQTLRDADAGMRQRGVAQSVVRIGLPTAIQIEAVAIIECVVVQ